MAFADPSSLPLSSGAVNLTRTSPDGNGSIWRYATSLVKYQMRLRHSEIPAKGSQPAKERHNVEIIKTTFATSTVPEYTEKVYVVIEQLASNSSVELVDALADWLIATSNANTVKLLNWET